MGLDEFDRLQRVHEQAAFGDDPPDKVNAKLRKQIEHFRIAGLSLQGRAYLRELLEKYRRPFTSWLGIRKTGKVTPMKLNLTPGKNNSC